MGKADKFQTSTPSVPPGEYSGRSDDRRIRGERLEVSFPVYATQKGNPIQGYIEAQNISWSGMLLATNFPLNIGDRMILEFRLPGDEIPITVRSRVVHRLDERVPEEATMIGVVFEDVDPNVQRMIAGFVLENLEVS